MRLRIRLALAFFTLAVLPLAGITVYSYAATERAFRKAVEAEAASLAGDMAERMDSVTSDLSQRIEKLGDLPFSTLVAKSTVDAGSPLFGKLESELGTAAALVESFEFTPEPPATPLVAEVVKVKKVPGVPPLPPTPAPRVAREVKKLLLAMEPRVKAADQVAIPPEAKRHWIVKEVWNEAEAQAFREHLKHKTAAIEKVAAAIEAEAAARERFDEAHTQEVPSVEGNGAADVKLTREFACTAKKDGTPVGRLRAHVRTAEILGGILASTRRKQGEVPFAIDAQGRIHAPAEQLPWVKTWARSLTTLEPTGETRRAVGDWMVVARKDPASGLTLGIARPIGEGLREIRRTAARNFGTGLVLVCVAAIGILPLSRRMTHRLAALTEAAERLGRGDLSARVDVRSKDEIARLGETFNRMAQELRLQQERLVHQERLRKELELCRRIQEEMLPRDPVRFPFAEVKGLSLPAREVGGDFFNYFSLPGGDAALLVGDVSGKGVAAALLMANVQATLRARLPLEPSLARLADHLDHEIEATTPRPTYLTLFVGVLDGRRRQLRYVNAGQNPPLVLKAGGDVQTLDPTGRPLGLLPGGGYVEETLTLDDGDAFFLYTDGLVECEDAGGDPFGLARLEALLTGTRDASLEAILARVEDSVRAHRGSVEPLDDSTIVVLKVGDAPPAATAQPAGATPSSGPIA
jgi:serine phosphatase RsbU (regulator of sigma subunit)